MDLMSDMDDELLTVREAAAELRVAPSTFYYWRQKRCGPRSFKLPNGDVRIRRADLRAWLESRAEAA
jgi:predicted DNA-binding transcriptional regulator AlpA